MPRKKKRAKSGEGSFRIKPSGLIEYRFTYKDENGDSHRKSFACATRQECLDKADVFLTGRERLKADVDIDATIVEILRKKYKQDYEKNYLSDSGYGRNLDSVKILEKGGIGRMPIRKVQKRHIELYSTRITHYSNSTIEKIFLQLKIAFEIAMDEGLITVNPMLSRTLRRPKSKKADKKVRALTVEEQQGLIDAMEKKTPPQGRNDYRLQLFIELYSGMRMGEINALRPEDIDLKNNVVHVRATITKGVDNKSFVKDGTKTESGIRDVPISETLKPYLEAALKQYKKNPEKLIFYNHTSKSVITTNQVNSYYKRVCSFAGIESEGQHALRHTFATRCIESGIPAVVLKTWLGHTDIHMTLDTYTDVFKQMDLEAVEKLDRYMDSYTARTENEDRKEK